MNSTTDKSYSRFLVLWAGQLASSIGSGMTAFALGIYAFQQTHAASEYSLIILLAFLPSFLLKPIGGVLADRLDRKFLMIFGDIGAAAGVLFIALMLWLGSHAMWPVYLGVAVSSVFFALQNPAYKAVVTDLLDPASFTKASGLMQLAESSRYLVSPILAGALMSVFKIETVLLIDVATFAFAIMAVMWVKRSVVVSQAAQPQAGIIADLRSGFDFVFTHGGILGLLMVTSLVTFAIGFLQALIGPMMLAYTDAQTLGMTLTLSATGMLAGGVLIGIWGGKQGRVNILSVSMACAGLCYALMGVSTQVYFIVLSGFSFFFALTFVNTHLDVLIRQNVAMNFQGRVWSIVSLISQTGMVIAFGSAGYLADHLFNPLLQTNGALAASVGSYIGVGPGRGIGLLFVLSGIVVILTALMLARLRVIRALEVERDIAV